MTAKARQVYVRRAMTPGLSRNTRAMTKTFAVRDLLIVAFIVFLFRALKS
jgi:hypothetical protein